MGTEDLGILLDRAHAMHQKGFNCAETVLWALGQHWNLDCDVSGATGFGGGVARLRETCGGLTGAILALGLKIGRTEPTDEEKKLSCYRLGQEIARRFVSETGSTQCRDILGIVGGPEGDSRKNASPGFSNSACRNAVKAAIRAAIAVADEEAAHS